MTLTVYSDCEMFWRLIYCILLFWPLTENDCCDILTFPNSLTIVYYLTILIISKPCIDWPDFYSGCDDLCEGEILTLLYSSCIPTHVTENFREGQSDLTFWWLKISNLSIVTDIQYLAIDEAMCVKPSNCLTDRRRISNVAIQYLCSISKKPLFNSD